MKVGRMSEIETNDIQIGDQIHVGHYTATCQEITSIAAIFLLDQYLDKPMAMNTGNTNRGGYGKSDLRKTLQSDEVLDIFAGIRDYMVPFENGDLLRIPFASELFGDKLPEWCEQDGHEQWPLIQDRHNRLALRCEDYEWGWINNKTKSSSTHFCAVSGNGTFTHWDASNVLGVRPVFQISMRNEETIQDILDTFNEKQRFVLYYIVGKAVEGEETILDVLGTFNEKQRLVLNCLVDKAVEDAKKGKTSESNEEDE